MQHCRSRSCRVRSAQEQEIQEKVSNTKSDKIISHFRSKCSNEQDTLLKTKRAHMSGNIRSRNRDCLGNAAFYEMVGHGAVYSTLISTREPNECGHLAENRSVLQVKTVPPRSRMLFFRHGLRLSMKKQTQRNCTASTNTARLNLPAVRPRHRLFRCSIDCCLVQDVCQRSSALYEKPPVSFSGQ